MRIFTEDNKKYVGKTLSIAWPAVVESFFVALVGLIDSFMVSGIGAYAVAAVGLTTQPKFIGLALFIATNVAVSALVARRKGQKDRKSANGIFIVALLFTVLAGIVVSIACVVFAHPIIRLCGSAADTHQSAVTYFRIIMGCMMFNIISLVINAAQRGAGKTKIAMRTNLTSNIINLFFNYLLIDGHFGFPRLGVMGAAIATVLGTVVACGMSIASIMKEVNFVSIPYIIHEKIKPSIVHAGSILKISSNIFAEQVLLRIGFMSVAIMAARLGTNEFAAHQVAMNIMGVSFSFGDGMQVAAVSLIGQSLGQGKPEIAKLYGTVCRRIGYVISALLAVVYLLGGRRLYEIFFDDPEIVQMGTDIMKVMVVIVVLQVAQVIYMGCLRGAGDVLFTTITSTISVTIVRPVSTYIMCYALGFGVVGIWMGVVADQCLRYALTSWRFAMGKWMKVEI